MTKSKTDNHTSEYKKCQTGTPLTNYGEARVCIYTVDFYVSICDTSNKIIPRKTRIKTG
jgi:hypothetical protein